MTKSQEGRDGWGGARKRAGRKPNYATAGASHLPRPVFARRASLHVRIKVRKHVWNLQAARCAGTVERVLEAGGDRFGFKIVQPLVREDHIHLLVEADDEVALGRGMKGLGVRMARMLNRLMERHGMVLDDRYRALDAKLRMFQDNLVLLVDLARQRQTFVLEFAVAVLIAMEMAVMVWQILATTGH